MISRKALIVPVYLADESPENIPYDVSTSVAEAQKVCVQCTLDSALSYM